MQSQSLQTWQNAERHLEARQPDAARTAYRSLLVDPDWVLPAHLRLSSIAAAEGRVRDSVAHALSAYAARETEPDADPVLMETLCKQLCHVGELQAAIECAMSPVVLQTQDASVPAEIGTLMSDQSCPEQALVLLNRARQLGADSPALRYLIGLSAMYSGDLTTAEHELGRCLQSDPGFPPPYRMLSKLRKQTAADNHVGLLRAAIVDIGATHPDTPVLQYALFKELDDLGETDAAWQALDEGMRLRRAQLHYDDAAEQALFDHLSNLRGDHVQAVDAASAGGPVPIFIVGMPRSGTTLLERILGAHPQVTDAGELRDFICQLRWMCDRTGGPHLDLDLAQYAERIDWAELGRRYLQHTQWLANGRAFYTDKLPTNFLNIGYIARALPQAKILHMIRDPMDVCFSNLKELFAEAYPHSYDQGEMADHFTRYRTLMAHWHAQFPGRILDVHYDTLVADPTQVARRVLDFCGLPWNPMVVAIEARVGAVATASATQIREPIHQRFVGQWRRYEARLQPLRERLGF